MEFFCRRQLLSPLLLLFVLFTLFDSILSKHHIRHHRDRFKRQQGAHLYLPGTSVTSGGEGPDAGPWTEWSEPSSCSRTCGGGVSTQQRDCHPGYTCQGPSKRHFSCNTQDCPDISDYRSQQCSEFDRIPFEGVYYQWTPYTKAPNPCELNCMPKGERFYYRHQQHVVDGTRCNDEKLDVCVAGTCQPVGCDMMLGSDAAEDRCRQCGGDGSMCNTVTGLLDMQDLQVGYNDILLIPAGATNINVREIADSNNYLAVRNTTGHYYLNGHWRIDFPRSLEFADCKFHYNRYPKGFAAPDSITCLGPTDEALFIVLLYQDVNVGVEYEYSIPKNVQPSDETETYAWTFDEFTPCTTTCGGGIQYRNVSCAGRRTLEPADRSLCDHNNEPPFAQRCGEQPCEPRWVAKPWDKCSAPCGDNGTQTRQVYCEQIIANGVASIVDDEQCVNVQKPPTEQPCNQGLVCANWHVDKWKPCDRLCGEGKETRKVICYRKEKGTIEVLDDSDCAAQEDKPEVERKCNLRPCEGVDWVTSEWSGCEDKCGLANETRRAECATVKGEIYAKELCEDIPIPDLVRQCNTTDVGCDFKWYTSQWSECSAKCGSGVQTRKVFCGSLNDEGIKKVEDDKCDPNQKYNGMKNCTADKKECTGEWFSGPWSKCSKPCGGGERVRKVICLRENVAVSPNDCDPNTIAFSSEVCNTEACSEDQILSSPSTTGTSVTEPVDKSESLTPTPGTEVGGKKDPEKDQDGDEEYEDVFAETCEDGEWVDDEEEKEVPGRSSPLADGKTPEEGESTESSLFSDELMLGDDTTAYSNQDIQSTDIISTDTGSGDGELSSGTPLSTESSSSVSTVSGSTVEGSGDYSTLDISGATESGITESSDTTKDASSPASSDSSGLTTESSGTVDTSSSDLSDVTSDSSDLTSELANTDSSELTSRFATSDSSGLTSESGPTMSSDLTPESASSGSTEPSTLSSQFSSIDSSGLTSESDSTDASDFTSESSPTDLTPGSDGTPASDITPSSETTPTSDSSLSSDYSSTSESLLTDITGLSSLSSDSSVSQDVSAVISSTGPTIPFVGESELGAETDEDDLETTLIDESPATASSTDFSGSTVSGASTEESTDTSASIVSGASTEPSTDITGSSVSGAATESSTDISGSTVSAASTEESTGISGSSVSGASTEESTSVSGASTEESTTASDISTESAGSSVSEDISSTTEFTVVTETTTEFTGSTESTTEYTGSTEFDIWSSTQGSGLTTESTSSDLWGSTSVTEIFVTKKMRKCRKKKKKDCKDTKYGCCIDKVTPAKGPFDKGCPTSTTCKETPFGCCEDGVSVAMGKNFEGCPVSHCNETLFGCCPDNKTEAEGNNNEGCPPPPPECLKTKYGCCKDNITEATGPNEAGCEKEETTSTTVEPTTEAPEHCSNSTYGCCPDGQSSASGEDFEGCDIIKDNCTESYFGCCPDRSTSAKGPNYKGCKMPCEENQYGCCEDGVTPAHGSSREGCCLATQHGCCPDNIRPAQGPNLEGCGCQYSPYRCCPDNVTAARGYNNEGCGCQYTQHGCCPDSYTPAAGPEYQGCQCHTFQFGCCPDGVSSAQGPHQQGCGCRNTEYGCCADEESPAQGPNHAGCGCESTKYGCCMDGFTEAQGENFEECEEIPANVQASCTLEKERGPCRNYTVKWFFDSEYGGCSRFWYGGCDGNANRFKSKEECNDICVEPQGRDRCFLPKVSGACEGYYPQWHYDNERRACTQFIYGGCLGNNNRFETREECTDLCVQDSSIDACEQPKYEGPCRGNFPRWYFDKNSGICTSFVYGGCKSNNNNFLTESACRQKCLQPGRKKDHCSLPRAQGNCTGRDPRWYYDASEKRCMPFYYSGCGSNNNNFASQEACEADCPKEIVKDTCQLPAEIGDCGTYTNRWYYDTKDKTCRQFYYGGCGGNANNFESEHICQQRCEIPATAAPPEPVPPPPEQQPPQPLPTQPPQQPGPGAEEPFRTEFCFLDSDTGPCLDYVAKWYYDKNDGACKQFMYGGCPGNGNNFETVDDCQDRCGNVQDLCTLPVIVGPCNGEYEQWYYSSSTDSCQTFTYGGCLGNNNRFDDVYTCEQQCKQRPVLPPVFVTQAPPPVPTSPTDSSVCYVRPDPGNCSDSISSYYYDVTSEKCSAFVYTGCGGNANRYNSLEQCERQCGQFRGQNVCRLQRDPGPCRESLVKYYYDAVYGRCAPFYYGGCDGNGNRFSSLEECEYVCVTHEEKKPPEIPQGGANAICRLPLDVGPCEGGYHKHYYFDDIRGECAPFIYSGCGGNFNNFKSFQACLDFCKELMVPTEEPPSVVEPAYPQKGEHPCQKYIDECGTMRCEYGTEAYVDEETLCTRCRCHNPCRNTICDQGSQCAVDLNRNRTTYEDPTFIAVCRPINKEGECPSISSNENRCERECENDADCSMDLKCCSTGCGTSCVEPVLQVPAQLVTTPYLPAYTQSPVQAGYFPPKVDDTKFKPEVSAGEGDYATLDCAVQGNPTPTITWKRGKLLIDGTEPRYRLLLDGALQIITLHKTDSGIYLCAADNGIGHPLEKAIQLNVTDSEPHTTVILGDDASSHVVALGAPTTLQCYATGYPYPAVTWWKDDSMIPLRTNQFEVRKDYSLFIHSVQLSNLGIYTCQAYNGIGKAASWSVTVQALGPVYSTKPQDSKYMQYVINPPESPTRGPYRPEYPYRPEPRPDPRPQVPPPYIDPNIDPNEILPEPPAEGHRVYQVPVRANITQTQNRFRTGSDISLGCDVDGYPIPQVQWYKDGQPLYPSDSIQISESHRLYINNANQSDSGEYRCEASNDYSRSASSINIAVEGLYIHPNCTDNPFFANCALIVRAQYCVHKYYARFCCKSCTEAGQLPSHGPHLGIADDKHSALSSNLVRRK